LRLFGIAASLYYRPSIASAYMRWNKLHSRVTACCRWENEIRSEQGSKIYEIPAPMPDYKLQEILQRAFS